jgi:hypothetical protein
MYRRRIIIAGSIVLAIVIGLVVYGLWPTSLAITANPEKIEVYVGVDKVVTTPSKTRVKPGKYDVWALETGYNAFITTIEVKKHRVNKLAIVLTKADEPPEGASPSPAPTPAIQNLPYSSDHFRIDWDNSLSKYIVVPRITLYFDQSPQEQIQKQWSTYQQYAAEALAWMKKQGITPTDKNIEWWGQEWWPTGASIKIN